MTVFNPLPDLSALRARLVESHELIVACYCAQWCDTCRAYRADFENLAAQWPRHVFVWIDIEDSPDLLGDVDVENFPTIALQDARRTVFFGTLLPYASHLDRLIGRSDSLTDTPTEAPPLLGPLLVTETAGK
ncbi:MAG TPA: thioredoxin family protein [Burkholderiaceae bacterium]|nr:thioredoxin family protein [Burkholderiaceae bacterium]